MTGEDAKRIVPVWTEKVGLRKARVELQNAGLGFSTADKLCKGEYESTPTQTTVDMIKRALAGFLEQAS